MTTLSRARRTIVEIDLADYLDDIEQALDTQDCVLVRDYLEEARRCLNRPERSTYEAIEHIERALAVINGALE